ncbi:MAG: Polyphenol oxidase [Gammaproteobacteria bacterium]|nr:Polyphenol oxidase [Gammaproteobacteria bacterium]
MSRPGNSDYWLRAAWPAPNHIHAGISTRAPGYSQQPYAEFNLALHVGDDTRSVQKNRDQLQSFLRLPTEPHWLNQTHGNQVVEIHTASSPRDADAAYTHKSGVVCALLTADCVPILVCNRDGTEVAAIHAGWRGLAANIIAETLTRFKSSADDLMAWIGPHISATSYTVREDVRNACINSLSESVTVAFHPNGDNTWQADLSKLASMLLSSAGVTDIYDSNLCTYENKRHFYSYRREKKTGRMASLIWIDHELMS